jgi:hypothetical protein
MGDVPLPPWMRRIQQSFYWQFIVLPVLVGFGVALTPCIGKGIQNIEAVCAWGAVNTCITSLITQFVSGHSIGSASFKPTGEPNKVVENVIEVQKAVAATPTPEIKMAAQSIALVAAEQAAVIKEAVRP